MGKRRLLTDLKAAAAYAAKRVPDASILGPSRRISFVIGYLTDIYPEAAKALELALEGKERPRGG